MGIALEKLKRGDAQDPVNAPVSCIPSEAKLCDMIRKSLPMKDSNRRLGRFTQTWVDDTLITNPAVKDNYKETWEAIVTWGAGKNHQVAVDLARPKAYGTTTFDADKGVLKGKCYECGGRAYHPTKRLGCVVRGAT